MFYRLVPYRGALLTSQMQEKDLTFDADIRFKIQRNMLRYHTVHAILCTKVKEQKGVREFYTTVSMKLGVVKWRDL